MSLTSLCASAPANLAWPRQASPKLWKVSPMLALRAAGQPSRRGPARARRARGRARARRGTRLPAS